MKKSSIQALPDAWTPIVYDDEVRDDLNEWANSTFTPTEAGKYLINVTLKMGLLTTKNSFYLKMYKNGSYFRNLDWYYFDAANARYTLHGNTIVDLNAGDTIKF
ncbi:MAG: hypothetical protein KAX49_13915 [Halanaerobiales bacterium]|nr:hypothetical protein [Halanaerobiales bacterium]